jgi:PHD/YefM family antitoxin component YafN of YafNO toxin-antitoxin module
MANVTLERTYILDQAGERVGVILSIEEYQRLLEALEELECIRISEAEKASPDEVVPFEQALDEIEHNSE